MDTVSHFGYERTNGTRQQIPYAEFLHHFGELVGNAMLTRGQLWAGMLDNKRKIDEECNYPPTGSPVGVDLFKELYDREAVPARIVEVLPAETWQSTPTIVDRDAEDKGLDEPSDFEQGLIDLCKGLTPGGGPSWHEEEQGSQLWEYLRRFDILSGIGQFGVLLLGFDDGANLQDPVEGSTVVVNTESTTVHWGDSPITTNEAAYLDTLATGPLTRRVWTHNAKTKIKGVTGELDDGPPEPQYKELQTPALNSEEVAALAKWKHDRVVYNRLVEAKNTFDDLARTSPEAVHNKTFIDLLSGTDRQYFESGTTGMGMAQFKGTTGVPGGGLPHSSKGGSAAQGTDQQYMGVQFGPSQGHAEEPSKKERKLLFVRAFDESLVQVVRYEWNVNNPRFGQPVMYRITLNDPRKVYSGVGLPLATVFVHWSRVIHTPSDGGASTSEVFGTPRMQQSLNRCLDLRKLYAAGAEGYWQSCFASWSLETHPQAGGDVKVDYTGLTAMMTDLRNRLRRDILLEGMSAKTLPPSIVDPSPFITSQIEAICIKIPCPKRVFMGSERGELASSQDDAQWNDVIRGRQYLWVTPRIIVPLINRLILVGVLPEPKDGYRVDWPDLDSLNDSQKATVGLTITQALAAGIQGGIENVMPMKDYLVKVFSGFFDEDEVDAFILEAEKAAEEKLEEQQALADEQGFEPAPPPGFQAPPEPPPPGGPVKMKPGEALVNPGSGKTVAKQPLPKPPFGGKTGK